MQQVHACNTVGAASCNTKPDDRNQVLPQGTNIHGVYLAWGLDGSVQLANSTYGIQTLASLAKSHEQTEEKVGAWRVPPLAIGQWYNLSVSIGAGHSGNVSCVGWTLSGSDGVPTRRTFTLPPNGGGGYPTQGQLGLGLISYGAASIDDLVVEGSSATMGEL
jgi:hypothetical protein